MLSDDVRRIEELSYGFNGRPSTVRSRGQLAKESFVKITGAISGSLYPCQPVAKPGSNPWRNAEANAGWAMSLNGGTLTNNKRYQAKLLRIHTDGKAIWGINDHQTGAIGDNNFYGEVVSYSGTTTVPGGGGQFVQVPFDTVLMRGSTDWLSGGAITLPDLSMSPPNYASSLFLVTVSGLVTTINASEVSGAVFELAYYAGTMAHTYVQFAQFVLGTHTLSTGPIIQGSCIVAPGIDFSGQVLKIYAGSESTFGFVLTNARLGVELFF